MSGELLLPEGTGRLLVNSRGALEDLNPQGSWGQRILTEKEWHWEDVSLQKRPWTRSGRFKSSCLRETMARDFPGGPIVKNPSCNARNTSLSPGQETKIHEAHTLQLLGLWTLEAAGHNSRAHVPKPLSLNSAVRVHVPQQKILHDVMKILHAITKTLHSQIN